MADLISKAIQRVKYEIPRQILKEAFKSPIYGKSKTRRFESIESTNIDDGIVTKVIEGMIRHNLSGVAGTTERLPLSAATKEILDPWNVIYRFDERSLGGKVITSVIELVYGLTQTYGTNSLGPLQQQGPRLMRMTRDIANSNAGTMTTGSAYVEVIGGNAVLVSDVNLAAPHGYIVCTTSYDSRYNEIKPAYHRDFTELVVWATKAYIYNKLYIDVDEAVIRSGATIGAFKDVLDGYSDAINSFNDLIDNKWRKLSMLNDTLQMRDVAKLAMPRF